MKPFRDGQERQSGTIRTAPARIRSRGDDQEPCEEAWHSPADGTSGNQQCDPAGPEEDVSGTTEAGTAEGTYRADAGSRPAGAAQATAHGAPGLGQAAGRTCGAAGGGADSAAVRGSTEARTGAERPGSIRAAELPLGPGSAGRLVRSGGEAGRRAPQAAVLRDAEHGIGRRLPPRLHQRDATSVSGRARARLR